MRPGFGRRAPGSPPGNPVRRLTIDVSAARSPGRISNAEVRDALAAPADADGFVSRDHQAGGVRLHVRQKVTAADGLPCVLLHGLAVSHRYLMPTARELGDRPVFVPDLPGFGRSARPAGVFDVRQHAAVVVALLESLGPADLLGHSFGSQVAVEVAARRPDLVSRLVLAGLCTDPAAATAWQQAGRLARSLPFEDPREAPILATDIWDAGPPRILRTVHHAVRDRVETKLPGLRVPVLLIRGRHDHVTPQDWQDHAAALIPDARAVTVDRAAHNVVATAGPQVGAAVRVFLGEPDR